MISPDRSPLTLDPAINVAMQPFSDQKYRATLDVDTKLLQSRMVKPLGKTKGNDGSLGFRCDMLGARSEASEAADLVGSSSQTIALVMS